MRFDNLGSMWVSAVDECLNQGHKSGDTLELISTSMTLTKPQHCLFINDGRKQNMAYLGAELAWYLSGTNRLDNLKRFAPSYVNYSDDGGETANGAYGLRGLGLGYLSSLAQRIQKNPESRQHVIPLWRISDMGSTSKDVPCTVSLQFLVRNGDLHLIVYMRSNDLCKGFIYDIPCFCLIQMLVADMARISIGEYHHHVGSLHIYDRDRTKLAAAYRLPTTAQKIHAFNAEEAQQLIDIFEGRPADKTTRSIQLHHIMEEMEERRADN